MSAARQAKLVLTLVDHVSEPAKGIVGALKGVNNAINIAGTVAMAPARAVATAGRAMRRQTADMAVMGAAMTLGLTRAGRAVYDLNDVLNEIEGRRFGKRDIFHLADGTEMTREAFRQRVTDLVTTIDKESPRNAGEIAKAYSQLVQAGLSNEQVEAVLPMAVRFAIAGNYDTEEAADRLTNVMTSMQMPMATLEQASESSTRAADTIAYAANSTNSSVAEMTEAFKYAAPSAAALGIDIEQLAAMFVIQARRGIKASEAGVSIRSMLTRMVRPTKMAAAALANYNIDLADYLEKSQEVTSKDVTNALRVGGLDASGAEGEIDQILATNVSTAEKVQKITAAISKTVVDSTTMSAETISEAVREVMFAFGENLDVERLIEDMQKAGIAVSDFFRIFDVRQGARTLSLFSDDVSGTVQKIRRESTGFAEALSDVRMQGIVGAVQRLDSALFGIFRAAADSGVLDTVSKSISSIAASLNELATVNPKVLEIGTYATMAVAALAPMGFALAGVASAAALAVNPIAWVVGGLGYLAYLNWDSLLAFGKSFGSSLLEGLGPRTQTVISKTKELLAGLFQTQQWDAAAWGQTAGETIAGFAEGLLRFVENSVDGIRRLKNTLLAASGELYAAGAAMIQSLWDGAAAKFESFIAWVRGIPGRIRAAIGNITIDNAISFVTGGNEPVAVPNIQGSNDNIAGARANGGPVKSGLTYLVGEEGPELFTPGRPGGITPNHVLGRAPSYGGIAVNMTLNVNGSSASDLEALARQAAEKVVGAVTRQLDRELARSEQVAFGGLRHGDA